MPWNPREFRSRHNKKLSDLQAERASHIANAVLERTGDEGLAIRVANARARGSLASLQRHR